MTIIPLLIVACWFIFVATWGIMAIGVKRNRYNPWWRRWWFRLIAGMIFASIIISNVPRWRELHQLAIFRPHTSNPILLAAALVLCVSGTVTAIWARIHLGRNWSSFPTVKEQHELVTSGPYHLVRHPIYTGVLLAVLGSSLISPAWIALFFIATLIFIWRIKNEEALMLKEFPDAYPTYQDHTWALIPWVW